MAQLAWKTANIAVFLHAHHQIQNIESVNPKAADILLAPDWKGNVYPQRDYKILIASKISSDANLISSSVLDAEYAE